MKYLLDTNSCIRFINGRSPQLRVKLLSIDPEEIAVCSVVKAEMRYGVMKSQTMDVSLQKQERFLSQFISLPFDDNTVSYYAEWRAKLDKLGTPIGFHDLQIAAIALTHDLIVVTHNTREFSRITDLKCEDWEI